MIRKIILLRVFFLLLLTGMYCKKKETVHQQVSEKPSITQNGVKIFIPDSVAAAFFQLDTVADTRLKAELNAPCRVIAKVSANEGGRGKSIVVFSDPQLTANYSTYLERLVNIHTYKLNLERVTDLYNNGATSGRELIEARTKLENEEAAIIENEAIFIQAGLDAKDLKQNYSQELVWLICDIPENEIGKFKEGSKCILRFKAFEDEVFTGYIENIGDVVDNITRMTKLRIEMKNEGGKIKAGMFATAQFGLEDSDYVNVPEQSVITVQGKEYIFVKTGTRTFERREVQTGKQLEGRIVILEGLKPGELVVTSGVMQLKGISFGY